MDSAGVGDLAGHRLLPGATTWRKAVVGGEEWVTRSTLKILPGFSSARRQWSFNVVILKGGSSYLRPLSRSFFPHLAQDTGLVWRASDLNTDNLVSRQVGFGAGSQTILVLQICMRRIAQKSPLSTFLASVFFFSTKHPVLEAFLVQKPLQSCKN